MRDYGNTNAAPYASAPAVGLAGDTYWNTTTSTLYVSNGTAWVSASGGPPTGTAGGDLAGTYPNPTVVKASGNFTATGIVQGNVNVRGGAVGTNGSVMLNPGDPTHPGYVSFHDAAGTRLGYVGYKGGTGLQIMSDTGNAWEIGAPLTLPANCVLRGNIATGHGIRTMNWVSLGSPALPVNAWTLVASAPVTVAGGWVWIFVDLPLSYAMASSAATFYTTVWRDGAPGAGTLINGSTNRYTLCSSGFVYVPVPSIIGLDNGAAAGAHTYYVYIYPANCACQWGQDAANYRGIFGIFELV